MAKIVIKDLDHPDFPHGEERGYSRGCHQQCCREAKTRANNQRDAARAAGQPAAKIPTGRAVRHIARLRRAPGFTYRGMSRLCGVHPDTLAYVYRFACVTSPDIEARILSVTAQQIRPPAAPIERPRAEAIRMLRAVQAHGWPVAYMAAQIGQAAWHRAVEDLVGPQPDVPRGRWQAIQDLYRTHEARPGPSESSRLAARAAGYYPPACYDDDGSLILAARRREDYKGTDETQAATRWAVLRMILALHTVGEITERLDVNEKQVGRVKDRWGIRLGPDATLYGTIPPRQRPLLRILHDALAEVDLFVVDPIEHEAVTADRIAAWRRCERAKIKADRRHLTVAVRRQRTLQRERDVRPIAA